MSFDAARAKAVDLIILPPGIEGKNCNTCEYNDNGYCDNKKVLMSVEPNWGCKLWDHPGVKPAKPPKSKFTLEYFKSRYSLIKKEASKFIKD